MIDSHFPLAPFWALSSLVNEVSAPQGELVSLDRIEGKTGRLLQGEGESNANGRQFRKDDVLFGKLRPYLAKYWLADRPGTAQGDIHVYRPTLRTDPRFLAYIVGSDYFTGLADTSSTGSKMPRVEWPKVAQFRVPFPPRRTQRTIADYLDRETAEIDAMTVDLAKMEALLTERRATTVRSTMDQAAEFGRIPLGYVAQTVAGATPSTSIAKYWADSAESGIHWVSIGDMSSVPVVLETQKYVSTEGRKAARLKVAGPGTVLFAMYGATLGAVSRLGVDACWNQAILGVFPHESRLRSEFLESALIALKPSLEALHRGNTQNNLNAEQVKGLPIPLPPLEVQEAISQELSEKTAEIDSMLADITALRDLLAERRAALIAAAVTGQIDIPTAEETPHA